MTILLLRLVDKLITSNNGNNTTNNTATADNATTGPTTKYNVKTNTHCMNGNATDAINHTQYTTTANATGWAITTDNNQHKMMPTNNTNAAHRSTTNTTDTASDMIAIDDPTIGVRHSRHACTKATSNNNTLVMIEN